ncbi:hypothetical protein [Acinetobacter bereziniae]|uniref:hypothetical protein n=1 Tax=Acinetobacter bereziniae TaxID=106648 RepID=UPI00374F69B2
MTKKIRKINFEVKKYDGFCGGLCMQIIPSSIENNMNYLNSIVIGETAFSLIERFFFKGEDKWAHWRNIYLDSKKVEMIIARLEVYRMYLNSKAVINENDDIHLIFNESKLDFIENFLSYKNDAIEMMNQIINFLKNNLENKLDGITVIGV